ncbi:TRAFAC clade GTPase domain-containing protein [Vallitalea guaymasensis]|uniref:TRAFAC clade GTPase domain-containing protein n=1 Tax=Vallitalea guaymasensis TaxID=1185412 RepID=UPI000DE1D54E|nr:hypothetical protein [Vallitalea guaymasensis]
MDVKDSVDNNQDVVNIIDDKLVVNIDDELNEDQVKYNEGNIHLPFGNTLTLKETFNITAAAKTKTIVLIGPPSCGKTTIETTLYQMFQISEFGDNYFAGSKTILGFEERAYYTRIKSKQSKPETPRTTRGTEEFLHLKIWNNKTSNYYNFLFADLSGEDIINCIGNVEAMKNDFKLLKNVDYIVAVIDGESIRDKGKRHKVFEETAQLLQTIFDAELINEFTNVQLVFSKYDKIQEYISEDNMLLDKIKSKKTGLIERLKNYYSEIELFDIAAMPTNENCEVGYGLLKLMESWTYVNEDSIKRSNKYKGEINNEFNKLYDKLLGGNDE